MNNEYWDKLKNIKLDFWLLSLILLSIIGCVFFVGHFNEILIDFGREVYYPEAILKGKVLYKDLFNIYGPFSYLINAFWYKIFGIKLQTLYFTGSVLGILFVAGIYSVSKIFLDKFSSFLIGLFTIVVGITSPIIHNFTFTYSQAMLYGVVFFIWSLYWLCKSQENNELRNYPLYLSVLFAGFAVTNKYEFILYWLFLLVFIIKLGFKNIKKSVITLLAWIFPIIFSYGILFVQGLKISELVNSFLIIKTMMHTQTLRYFYQNSGIMYSPKVLAFILVAFLKAAIIFGLIYSVVKLWNKHKKFSILAALIVFPITILLVVKPIQNILMYLPILILIVSLINFKKIKDNKLLLTLIISSLLVSAKCFWALLILSYGSYYAPVMLIALFAFVNNDIIKKSVQIFLIILIICILNTQIQVLMISQNKISYNNNFIYSTINIKKSTNELINYLQRNINSSDKVLILPEGMIVNFLTNTQSEGIYNSFLPLYIETFGEDKIIEYYAQNKPEYIVFTDSNMKDYGFNYICNDYALGFCKFVSDNYNNVKTIDSEPKFLIYERK